MDVDQRFRKSTVLLNRFLQMLGADLYPLHQHGRIRRYAIRIWGLFLLALHFQATGSMYLVRLESNRGKWLSLEKMNYLISRTFMMLLNWMAHWFLVMRVGPLFASFIQSLQELDKSLGRPDLSSLYKYSAMGIAWIFFTVFKKSN